MSIKAGPGSPRARSRGGAAPDAGPSPNILKGPACKTHGAQRGWALPQYFSAGSCWLTGWDNSPPRWAIPSTVPVSKAAPSHPHNPTTPTRFQTLHGVRSLPSLSKLVESTEVQRDEGICSNQIAHLWQSWDSDPRCPTP